MGIKNIFTCFISFSVSIIYIAKNRDRMLKLNPGNFKWKSLKERKNQPTKQEKS